MLIFFILTAVTSRFVAVVELCRHGHRSPVAFAPWDNYEVWPQGPGELSPEGMRQHYLLGTEFRKRYIENLQVITPDYLQPEVFVFSTDVNRTLMSAQSQIQGFFPYGTGPSLRNASLEYTFVPPINVTAEKELIADLQLMALPNLTQIIPIHTDDESRQLALDSISSCSYYGDLLNYRNGLPGLLEILNEYPDVVGTVMQAMNYNKTYAIQMLPIIADSLICNQFVNHPFPPGFNETFFIRVQALLNDYASFVYRQPDFMARLGGSALLSQILEDLTSSANLQTTTRYYIYSAHDTTVSIALAFLQFNVTTNPPYASTLIFELTENNSEYFVAIKYNDAYLLLPTCPTYNCSLYNFTRYINTRAFPDIKNVCSLNMSSISSGDIFNATSHSFHLPGHNDDDEDIKWYFLATIIIYSVLAFILLVLIIFSCRKTSQQKVSERDPVNLSGSLKSR